MTFCLFPLFSVELVWVVFKLFILISSLVGLIIVYFFFPLLSVLFGVYYGQLMVLVHCLLCCTGVGSQECLAGGNVTERFVAKTGLIGLRPLVIISICGFQKVGGSSPRTQNLHLFH